MDVLEVFALARAMNAEALEMLRSIEDKLPQKLEILGGGEPEDQQGMGSSGADIASSLRSDPLTRCDLDGSKVSERMASLRSSSSG